MANALAYYDTATITAVKFFIVQAPGEYTIQLFMAVINSITKKARLFVTARKKWLTITKALAYCSTKFIMVIKVL